MLVKIFSLLKEWDFTGSPEIKVISPIIGKDLVIYFEYFKISLKILRNLKNSCKDCNFHCRYP